MILGWHWRFPHIRPFRCTSKEHNRSHECISNDCYTFVWISIGQLRRDEDERRRYCLAQSHLSSRKLVQDNRQTHRWIPMASSLLDWLNRFVLASSLMALLCFHSFASMHVKLFSFQPFLGCLGGEVGSVIFFTLRYSLDLRALCPCNFQLLSLNKLFL